MKEQDLCLRTLVENLFEIPDFRERIGSQHDPVTLYQGIHTSSLDCFYLSPNY